MPRCDFKKVAKHGCSPLNLLHIFRTPFLKNTCGQLLLSILALDRVLNMSLSLTFETSKWLFSPLSANPTK